MISISLDLNCWPEFGESADRADGRLYLSGEGRTGVAWANDTWVAEPVIYADWGRGVAATLLVPGKAESSLEPPVEYPIVELFGRFDRDALEA